MANPFLTKKPDKELKRTIREVLKDRKWGGDDLIKVLTSALDGSQISDVEYRDLKRFMRTERRLSNHDRLLISAFIDVLYPLEGPFLYPGDIDALEGTEQKGGTGSCAHLVQYSQPIGKAIRWREGIRVQGNDARIMKGTAVATFEDGFYPNRDENNHVAYYLSQDATGVLVMDQYANKDDISSRTMPFRPQAGSGFYTEPSNNGSALSVIMRKK